MRISINLTQTPTSQQQSHVRPQSYQGQYLRPRHRDQRHKTLAQAANQIKQSQKFTAKEDSSSVTYQRSVFLQGYDVPPPPPPQGRVFNEMQTDEFYENLANKPQQQEQITQTDFFIDRPVNRLFVPIKLGIDRSTQIHEGDLFDFNYEVEPILNALLTKTLQRARMQVLEQQQLDVMKKQKKQFENKRNVELARIQKIQASQKRFEQQADRRKLQSQTSKKVNTITHKKMISRNLAKDCLFYLKPNTYQILQQQSFFKFPLDMNLMDNFLPWLYEQVISQINNSNSYQSKLKEVVSQVQRQILQESRKAIESHQLRVKSVRRELLQKKQSKRQAKLKRAQEQQTKEAQTSVIEAEHH